MARIHKEAAFSLMWDRTLLENIILHLPNFAFWKNSDLTYMGCNENFAKLLGLRSPAEIIGKTDYELAWQSSESDIAFIQNCDKTVLAGNSIKNVEQTLALVNGKIITVLLNQVPLCHRDGRIFGILGTSVDITHLKKSKTLPTRQNSTEEIQRRALLVFFKMITHDLRTPLLSAIMRTSFLKKILPSLTKTYQLAKAAHLEVPELNPQVLRNLEESPDSIMEALVEANAYIDSSLKSLKCATPGENFLNKSELVSCNAARLIRKVIENYPYSSQENKEKIHVDISHDFNFMGNEIFFSCLFENLIKDALNQNREIFISLKKASSSLIKIKDTARDATSTMTQKILDEVKTFGSAQQIMKVFGGSITSHLTHDNYIEFVLSFPLLNSSLIVN